MNRAIVRQTLVDAVFVAGIGGLLALAANFFSPRGLSLHRDYFPAPAPAATGSAAGPASTPPAAIASAARLTRRGFAVIALARGQELFRDARRAEGRIVFVDARDDRSFQAGRIPGAIQLDHYRLERHAAAVLAACLPAEQVVVYCHGGNCEDSELAAGDLRDLGVPAAKILIFAGGFEEWRRAGLPTEAGGKGAAP
jgi:rhodanese-related sulfurtransferase